MKVILNQEVDNLGLAGDVVDVADGYGRNFLLPRGMAMVATKGGMKQAGALTRSRKVAESKTVGTARDHAVTLESRGLRIPARVDERGHLYGSVTVADIARVLKERGHQIDRKRIRLERAIKEIGTYEVLVQVHPQVVATVTIEVVDEEGVVIAGQIVEPEVAPLPGEVVAEADGDSSASDRDGLAEQAIDAAEGLEADEAATAEGLEADEAATAEGLEADEAAADRGAAKGAADA